jgi:hypothetical protein
VSAGLITLGSRRRRGSSEVPGALLAALLAGALAVGAIVLGWRGSDLPAQLFRVELFRRYGFVLWNSQWFGGTPTLDYSVVSPALAAALSPMGLAAVSGACSAFLFHLLTRRAFGTSARFASLWFATSTVTNLAVGRVTFGLGVTFALGAVLALQRHRPIVGALCGVLCALASPVAALFLAVAAVAWGCARRTERVAAWSIAVCAVAPIAVISLLFPSPGAQPYPLWDFACDLFVCGLVLFMVPKRFAALRWGAAIYGLVVIGAFFVATPLGGNVSRLNQYAAGPLLAAVLWDKRRALVFALAVPMLLWQWIPAVDSIAFAHADPSTSRAYYAPLLHVLDEMPHGFGRLEIAATYRHWESAYVAPEYALARGWERQLDHAYAARFYDGTLTASSYRRWLAANGVEYVALPDTQLDPSSKVEAQLLAQGLSYLTPVWHDAHWRLWKVDGFHGLVDGPGKLVSMGPDRFTVHVSGPGTVTVRIHASPHWAIDGSGCTTSTADGWIQLHGLPRGDVDVTQAMRGTPCDVDSS